MLDFEAWSDLAARLSKLDDAERSAVLSERGVSATDWQECEEHHNATLVDDVVHDRMDRRRIYGEKCAREIERRRRDPASTTKALELTAPNDMPTGPGRSGDDDVGEPAASSTVDGNLPTYLANPVLAEVPGQQASKGFVATVELLDMASFLKPKPEAALPFGAATVLPPAARQHDNAPARDPVPASRPAIGETVEFDAGFLARIRGELPFPDQRENHAPPEAPFNGRLSLQNYASLCAELSVFPERAADVLRRYGLVDEPARRALDSHWRARISADSKLGEEWRRLHTTYRDWLLAKSR